MCFRRGKEDVIRNGTLEEEFKCACNAKPEGTREEIEGLIRREEGEEGLEELRCGNCLRRRGGGGRGRSGRRSRRGRRRRR